MADKLGMLQEELVCRMGAEELHNWIAYSSLQNEDYKKNLENKINLEKASKLSDKEKDNLLRQTLNRFTK